LLTLKLKGHVRASSTSLLKLVVSCRYHLHTIGRSDWHVKVKSLRNMKADPFKLVGDDDISLGQDLRLPTYILPTFSRKGSPKTNDRVHLYQLRL